ncbi:16S rRNA (uracil1498-N3)-methyltransferase [Pedobacter sp. UYP30]|uniref:16S rRNA (uracil(1498)-N(3))-methyltransferase n=1 Tax=Pedobacter sp. UYP30 TaxID=1756400 RepID=UPI00339A82C0
MHIFYTPNISLQNHTLNEEESKHCIRVLRLALGDVVNLVDGVGGFYTAEISSANPKKVGLLILDSQIDYGKRNFNLHIAIAPTKNTERLEWFLEKATELGIDEITPIICQRSERKVVKPERLEKVITSAVKQSIKAYHPKLNEAQTFESFINSSLNANKYIAHCLSADEKNYLSKTLSKDEDCVILIGPEGDFTEEEINLALQKGYKAVTLGNARLRTETAALAACFEINYLNR